ncbi:hypothetical protein [Kribbella sp. NPDC003557]|uniref:hypothetical protein n=1 Tax=Kribbella sp. NPDC003557 TaxID=3154449 RepID=UPI0033BA82FF
MGVFAAAALVEGIIRPDLARRPLVTVLAVAVIPALIEWSVAGLLSVFQLTAHAGDLGLYSMMVILLHSLVRWGSGREIVLGTAFVTVVVAPGMYAASASWADVFGGIVLLLLFVALAAVFRYRVLARPVDATLYRLAQESGRWPTPTRRLSAAHRTRPRTQLPLSFSLCSVLLLCRSFVSRSYSPHLSSLAGTGGSAFEFLGCGC